MANATVLTCYMEHHNSHGTAKHGRDVARRAAWRRHDISMVSGADLSCRPLSDAKSRQSAPQEVDPGALPSSSDDVGGDRLWPLVSVGDNEPHVIQPDASPGDSPASVATEPCQSKSLSRAIGARKPGGAGETNRGFGRSRRASVATAPKSRIAPSRDRVLNLTSPRMPIPLSGLVHRPNSSRRLFR